jgi:Ca2+-binding EF-hand superfamily protein
MINLFRSYDQNNTGSIEERDFNNILRNLGYMDVSDQEIE